MNHPSRNFLFNNKVELFIILFCLVVYIIESINGRLWMNDFRVYYSAAEEMLNGHDIYGRAYGLGSGYFKYSPFAAMVFIPLAIFPFAVAKSILFFFTTIATVLIFYQLRQIIQKSFQFKSNRTADVILLTAFVLGAVHVVRELHLGNVNIILLFLLITAMVLTDRKKILAGTLIGLCILVKPHFLILLPLLILRRKIKTTISVLATVACGLLIPALFAGWQRNIFFLSQWVETMRHHSTELENAKQTLAYIIQQFFFSNLSAEIYFKIEVFVLLLFVVLFLWFLTRHFKSEAADSNSKTFHFYSEYFVLVALIPSLTITDTEHFFLALPLIIFLLAYGFQNFRNNVIFLSFLILILIAYGGNWHDLLGANVSDWIFDHSLLGIANVILISIMVFVNVEASPMNHSNPLIR